MTRTGPSRGRRLRRVLDAPLFAQLLALVAVSVVAAQAISFAVIYLAPPPAPAFFRGSEIARALTGAPQAPAAKRLRLEPLVVDAPPAVRPSLRSQWIGAFLRRELAQRLGRPESDVRLVLIDADPMPARRSVRLIRSQFAPEPLDRNADHFVVAPFEAAVRRPDGRWTMVRDTDAGPFGAWSRRMALWLGLSALAVAPLAYLFARRMASPFAAFAAAAERFGRDSGAPPLTVSGSPEIRTAVAAFNQMQERLRRYVDDRTGMLGAIAHDLRTPLTRLRFRVESVPPEQRPKMAADIEEMEAMIAAAMAFVRDASGQGERRPLELNSLVGTVASEMADTGLQVQMAEGSAVVVDGDALQLRRLVSNLLDNAVKFGVRARARVYALDGSAVVEIEDDGPGLPDGQRERVFEPFYRAEPSRSRQTGGVGLGLAVVRTIARAHGGDAELENRAAGGLLARARLPLARTAA